jgi:hypothetical protein
MPSKRLAALLVAGFALLFNYSAPQVASGQIPRPPTLEEMTRPQATAPQEAPAGPQAQCIATSTQRIERDRMEIRVYRNGRPVELFSHFHELVTATPAVRQRALDQLAGRSITLVPSEKQAEQWNVFTGVGVGGLVLADNIFKVRQVLLSSRKNLIEVHVDGQIHRLQPGQALLVL